MVCVLEGRGRSKNSNLNAVVVIQIIMVVVMVNWTMMIIDRGIENRKILKEVFEAEENNAQIEKQNL